ncbi:MAG: hypothetical protein V3S55_07670 [Nitrospiraceae bacterium]
MNRVFQEGFKPYRGSPKAERVQRFEDRLSRRFDQATFCHLRDRADKSAKAVKAAAELRWRNQDV